MSDGFEGAPFRFTSVTRRNVLGLAGLATAGLALSACGGSSSAAGTPTSTASAGGGAAGETILGSTMSIPVGGGTVYAQANVVVTQPKSGEFVGFSATCPHMGCQVALVQAGQIICPCHSSTFAVATGAVTGGPAPTGLTPVKVAVQGTDVVLKS
jgi:nitrite reductase/ring-hydroxylating ferredoxin subunit